MKNLYSFIWLILFFLLISVSACQKSNTETFVANTEAKKIAKAYGYEDFDKVETISYTFNVDVGDRHVEREWIWNTDTKEINYTGPMKEDSIATYTYDRDSLNVADTQMKTVDQRFINDKYWLLFPFNLVWDTDVTITEEGRAIAPIDSTEKFKLTVQYGPKGGYTPGDAYDLYYEKDDYLIDEWVFRKGGSNENPSAFTWENHQQKGPLLIATDHYGPNGNFRLYFTGVSVTVQ